MKNKQEFTDLVVVIGKELEASIALKELFQAKKEILKKSKSEELVLIDDKIISQSDLIFRLEKERKKIANILINKDGGMSDYITFAEENCPNCVKRLQELKVKICNNSKELVLLNQQNMELMKHGIVMTNKMLETIVDAFAPQGSNYNESGKTDTHDLNMWTVNEEI